MGRNEVGLYPFASTKGFKGLHEWQHHRVQQHLLSLNLHWVIDQTKEPALPQRAGTNQDLRKHHSKRFAWVNRTISFDGFTGLVFNSTLSLLSESSCSPVHVSGTKQKTSTRHWILARSPQAILGFWVSCSWFRKLAGFHIHWRSAYPKWSMQQLYHGIKGFVCLFGLVFTGDS